MEKTQNRDFYRIFVRAITLWKHFCSTKNTKKWKRVFTLPRAHQHRVFHEMFQVLALDARPKWWFSFFGNSEIVLPRTHQNIDFCKKNQKGTFFSFFLNDLEENILNRQLLILNFSWILMIFLLSPRISELLKQALNSHKICSPCAFLSISPRLLNIFWWDFFKQNVLIEIRRLARFFV